MSKTTLIEIVALLLFAVALVVTLHQRAAQNIVLPASGQRLAKGVCVYDSTGKEVIAVGRQKSDSSVTWERRQDSTDSMIWLYGPAVKGGVFTQPAGRTWWAYCEQAPQ